MCLDYLIMYCTCALGGEPGDEATGTACALGGEPGDEATGTACALGGEPGDEATGTACVLTLLSLLVPRSLSWPRTCWP